VLSHYGASQKPSHSDHIYHNRKLEIAKAASAMMMMMMMMMRPSHLQWVIEFKIESCWLLVLDAATNQASKK
jgi:hypothetical protein